MTNTGKVNLANNVTTDVVTVGGNYVGGGQLLVDYNTATATADKLNIAGNASGTTTVVLNRTGSNFFSGFLPIVTVSGGAPSGAFVAAPVGGFLLDSFGQNPADPHQFGVSQTVNPALRSLGGMSAFATSASSLLNDPISPYVNAKIDPEPDMQQFGLWARGLVGRDTQDITTALTSSAYSNVYFDRLKMSNQALQLGADYGVLNISGNHWAAHVGADGGVLDGSARDASGLQ